MELSFVLTASVSVSSYYGNNIYGLSLYERPKHHQWQIERVLLSIDAFTTPYSTLWDLETESAMIQALQIPKFSRSAPVSGGVSSASSPPIYCSAIFLSHITTPGHAPMYRKFTQFHSFNSLWNFGEDYVRDALHLFGLRTRTCSKSRFLKFRVRFWGFVLGLAWGLILHCARNYLCARARLIICCHNIRAKIIYKSTTFRKKIVIAPICVAKNFQNLPN